MEDFSFISLHRSIPEMLFALDERGVTQIFDIGRVGVVIPYSGLICQISNVPDGIAFDDDYTVLVVDGCDNTIADITDKVAITEATHDSNGTQQIAFEIRNCGLNYGGRTLLLKFVGIDDEYWSTPVVFRPITGDDARLDYYNTSEFEGISYGNFQLKQSIYIKGIFENGVVNESTASVYDGRFEKGGVRRTTPKVNRLFLDKYGFEYSSKFLFERVQIAFNHDYVYINGTRITDSPQLEDGEYLGSTNAFVTGFTAAKDRSDRYIAGYQIFTPLTLIEYYPSETIRPDDFASELSGTFDNPVTLSPGATIYLYNAVGNVLIGTYTEDDIEVTGSDFVIDIADLANGSYYWVIPANTFLSDIGNNIEYTIPFQIAAGRFDPDRFDNDRFFVA